VRVPYPGDAPMLTDLISGRVDAAVDALPYSLQHIRSGTVRALAILSARRTPALPDLPTVGDTVPGFAVEAWTAVGVPRGTPAEIIERLNREINAGLADPGIKARLTEVGGVPLIYTPGELGTMIAHDTIKWADVIKRAGIEPQ
jgi:tripartite-type tricarboxylate transporter receptor subunit TctC